MTYSSLYLESVRLESLQMFTCACPVRSYLREQSLCYGSYRTLRAVCGSNGSSLAEAQGDHNTPPTYGVGDRQTPLTVVRRPCECGRPSLLRRVYGACCRQALKRTVVRARYRAS
jgi:hypothetical protein